MIRIMNKPEPGATPSLKQKSCGVDRSPETPGCYGSTIICKYISSADILRTCNLSSELKIVVIFILWVRAEVPQSKGPRLICDAVAAVL